MVKHGAPVAPKGFGERTGWARHPAMFAKPIKAALAVLLIIAPAATRAADAPRPALWKLADADTTVYLFGTVHALPKTLEWKNATVAGAFDGADTLVVEVAEAGDAAKALQPMLAMGTAAPGSVPPLADRLPGKDRSALKALVAESGFPPAALDRFETWLAAIMLAAPSITKAGLDPETGVERTLMKQARERHTAIIGLETMEQQLGYFDTLAEADQRALLDAVVKDNNSARAEFAKLISAWAKGDVRRLERLADDELKASPGLRQALLVTRNRHWADWIAARMATPGTVFVAVGAGHLAGIDSVQAMLGKRGLKVERVQ